jgi:signal transduction histidine kinase
MGSINQLEQVLVNLVTNAMDAISDTSENDARKDHPEKGDPDHRNGRLKIATRLSENAEHVEIRVSDNGNGIHEGALSRIFDPFFTTKDVGQGTGLGLSISYVIMKEHGGSIEVAETGPGGSTFSMKLPAAHSTPLLS